MLYNSIQFGVFLLVVFFLYWSLRENRRIRNGFLLACSYYFYMCWNPRYLVLIMFSTMLDFFIGKAVYNYQNRTKKRILLSLSLIGNLGILAIFKYFNFVSANINGLGSFWGLEPLLPTLNLLLPVGISFYTFQTLSYTIEIYQGKCKPVSSITEFALFVSFFPQLVAGPIVRASHFLPQLNQTPVLLNNRLSSGLYLILTGLLKKIVIADMIGLRLVNLVFSDLGAYGGLTILCAVYGFKLQIYADFSGYSDIAIGSARLLGFELPPNFRSPYKATSISDYWSRWHLTMSSWFRDFVFYPLGGSKKGLTRTFINIMIAMILVGMWHGASWNFIIWGGYYGILLCLDRLYKRLRNNNSGKSKNLFRTLLNIFITFQITSIGALLFRVEKISDIGIVFDKFFISGGGEILLRNSVLLAIAVGYITHFLPESWKQYCEEYFTLAPAWVQAIVTAVILGLLIRFFLVENTFYYYQF